MPTIGEQIALAVHQGSPSGADANTAQLIAIMQMLSKAGEHTRDIAQWWEQRPQRKAARDEALRALLFQDAASGNVPIDALDMEGRVKLRALRKADKPYTSQGLNDALNSIKIPGGRLASSGAAKVDDGSAELYANEVDSIFSNTLIGLKDTSSDKEFGPAKTKLIEKFVSDNPSGAASLYIKAMKNAGSDPANLANLSEAQQAMIEASSMRGPGKSIFDKLNGLIYKQTTDAESKNTKFEAGPVLSAATMLPDGTPDTRTQAAIIAHATSNKKGATFANDLGLYGKMFPEETVTGKYYNPYSETFETGKEIADKLNDNPKFRGWAIEGSLKNERQALPPTTTPGGGDVTFKTASGKLIKLVDIGKGPKGKGKKIGSDTLPPVLGTPPDFFDMEGMFETGTPSASGVLPTSTVPPYTEAQYEQNQLDPSAYPSLPGAPPPTAEEYQRNRFGNTVPPVTSEDELKAMIRALPSQPYTEAEYRKNQFGGGESTAAADVQSFLASITGAPSRLRNYINAPSAEQYQANKFGGQPPVNAKAGLVGPTIGSDLEAIAGQGVSGLQDYINNPGPSSNIRDYLQGTSRIESDALPPVEREPGIGSLKNLSEQEQRALLELLMKLKSGVGAQQSPAREQYPGMGYGLRVR